MEVSTKNPLVVKRNGEYFRGAVTGLFVLLVAALYWLRLSPKPAFQVLAFVLLGWGVLVAGAWVFWIFRWIFDPEHHGELSPVRSIRERANEEPPVTRYL